jgi:hypothetical protein
MFVLHLSVGTSAIKFCLWFWNRALHVLDSSVQFSFVFNEHVKVSGPTLGFVQTDLYFLGCIAPYRIYQII